MATRHSEEFWKRIDRIRETIGDTEFIESLISAMSDDEAVEYTDYIEQMYEISDDEEDEDFE